MPVLMKTQTSPHAAGSSASGGLLTPGQVPKPVSLRGETLVCVSVLAFESPVCQELAWNETSPLSLRPAGGEDLPGVQDLARPAG